MVETMERPSIFIRSTPYERRPGLLVMSWFLAGAWLCTVFTLAAAWWLADYQAALATMLVILAAAVSVYLAVTTWRLSDEAGKQFTVEIDSASITLSVRDSIDKEPIQKSIALDEVESAEIHRYKDETVLVLRGHDKFLEMPLWALGRRSGDVMTVFKTRGIPVFAMPS